MKTLLLAAASVIALSTCASAGNLITFAQKANVNEVTATTNAGDTQTTLNANGAASIGQLITGAPPPTAFFDLHATSVDAAITVLNAVIQHYSGSFCVSTGAACSGTDVLSGTFTDAVFGALGGPGLVVNANNPPDKLVLASSLIPASELDAPNAFGLTFTNLKPGLAVAGSTIRGFTATFAGDASGARAAVPEPSTLAILGLGFVGLGAALRRRRAGHRGLENFCSSMG